MKHHTRPPIILGLVGLSLAACGASMPGTAAAAPFLYVADTKSDEISQFSASPSDFGALKPLAPSTLPAGQFPYGIAVSPQGTSVYAVDVGPMGHPANKVSQYTINPITGRLTPKSPATVPTGHQPESIAISPDGTSAYVNDYDAVSQYSIDPTTGVLTAKSPATVATGANTGAIAVTPNGKYVYVAICGVCHGVLRKHSSTSAASTPTGSTSATKSKIWEFRVNPRSGALSTNPVAIVPTGNGPEQIRIAPNGRSAYVAVADAGVWQYTIDPVTGKLTPKSPATVPTGFATHDIVFSPDGKNAYVVTVLNDKVSQYHVNRHTGRLSPRPMSTATTVLHPEAITIAPDGKSAYVTSENKGELSQYTINPTTGKIAPMSPATVPTASGSLGLAITPGP